MADEVRVDPAVLEARAVACRGLDEALAGEVTDVQPETADAARALAGWQVGGAVDTLLWWWRDDLTRLGGLLDATADGLAGCARDYRHTDHASADNFRALPEGYHLPGYGPGAGGGGGGGGGGGSW